MKRNLFPLLGIAFVVALAASGIFYGVFVGQIKRASRNAAGQELVVAAHSLDRGAVLKEADLKLSHWAGTPPPGSYKAAAPLVGKTIYAPILENEPVTDLRFSADKTFGGLGIRSGMRAVSIKVMDSGGLIALLRPGHRVDVQTVRARNSPEATLRTILQNAEVVSVQGPSDQALLQNVPATVTLLAAPV